MAEFSLSQIFSFPREEIDWAVNSLCMLSISLLKLFLIFLYNFNTFHILYFNRKRSSNVWLNVGKMLLERGEVEFMVVGSGANILSTQKQVHEADRFQEEVRQSTLKVILVDHTSNCCWWKSVATSEGFTEINKKYIMMEEEMNLISDN